MKKSTSYMLLAGLALVTFALGTTLPDTYFDYDFDKFFRPDDAPTRYFEQHRNTFGTDNDFVLVAVVSEKGVFNTDFYEKLEVLTEALKEVPHVTNVTSPSNATVPVREPLTGTIFSRPVLTQFPKRDSARVFEDPLLVNNLFSTDTSAVSIVLQTKERLGKDNSDELAAGLEEVLKRFEFDGVHVAGRAIGQVVYIKKIQGEFAIFMGIAIAFVIVLLYFMFRSFRGVVIPLVTVLLAVVWSIGILNLSGSGIGILLNMLPPVIFVVGMSDAVHLYARYLEELKRGHTQAYAIRQMVFDTGLATLLTSITTAIGFASLYFTGIPTLQEFGLLTAAGVLAAYVIAIAMMPAWLALTSPPEKTLNNKANLVWEPILERLYPVMIRRRRLLFGLLAVISVIFGLSSSQLGLNNYLLEDLRPSEPLRQDFAFFDQNFAGVRPFEVGLKLRDPDQRFADIDVMRKIEEIETYLVDQYGIAAVTSPVTVVKSINRSYNAGRNAYYALPEKERDQKSVLREYGRLTDAGKTQQIMDSSGTYARIFGRAGDWGAQSFAERNSDFLAFAEAENLDKYFEIEITGTGTLIDRTNQNLVYSLAKGLGVAFALISIIMGFMFRSVRMVGIALIPNILPLLAVASVMYWVGIDLKMSTSIIFTIAFGIAVDDTIHLLSRYKLELLKGCSNREALRRSYVHTGKALIITSIILFAGFISLCFSSFQSTFYIGLFVTLTLMFALIFDLTLLPALISLLPEKASGEVDRFPEKADNSQEQQDAQRKIEVPRESES
ncbi:MAG: MMPL family transporter [Flavobacteriales bacterium]|nr:MMPL family transporter [Flavobacteriales bacterium]